MKKKIYNYLKGRGGTASSLGIAHHVLFLRNCTRATAERIVRNVLGQDSLFIHDGLGNWHLNRAETPDFAHELFALPFVVCILRFDASDIRAAQNVRIACVKIVQNKMIDRIELLLTPGTGSPALRSGWQRFAQWLPASFIFVAESVTALKYLLQRMTRVTGIPIHGYWDLHLLNFAQNLLALPRRPDYPTLCQRFALPVADTEMALEQARSRAEILLHLLEILRENPPQSIEAFLSLGERRQKQALSRIRNFTKMDLQTLPESAGVYLFKDPRQEVVYVGKAKNLKRRLFDYFAHPDESDAKTRRILTLTRYVQFEKLDTELDALLREYEYIQKFQPLINKQQRLRENIPAQLSHTSRILISLSSLSEAAIVYVITAGGRFRRLKCPLRRLPRKRLREALTEMCFATAPADPASEEERRACVFAWRWLLENAAQMNVIDPDDFGSAEECVAALMNLLTDASTLREKTICRGSSA